MYRQCSAEGCEKNVVAKGFCDLHYRRQLHHGHLGQTRPVDWGSRDNHPLMQSWRWMRRSKKSPVCERWKDFWLFVADVGERPSDDHRVFRLDDSKPFGPENFFWRQIEHKRLSTETEKESKARYMREWAKRNPEKIRSNSLRKHFGIGAEEYDQMLEKQNGVCAICGKTNDMTDVRTGRPRNLAVDHCHRTGTVRKLLCQYCNQGLGNFKDDPVLLRKAAEYLETK